MSFDPSLTYMVLLAVFVVAVLIGATAIGGLLLVPVVMLLGNTPVQIAIPACLFSIFFSGVVSSYIFSRGGAVKLRDVSAMALPAGAAALAGAVVLPYFAAGVIELFIAVLCFFGFASSLKKAPASEITTVVDTSKFTLVCIGLFVGLGSSLSGTGGPLLLIPILMVLGFAPKKVVGIAQVIQLPIGGFAAVGNLSVGAIDFGLALPLTATVILGAGLGAMVAQKADPSVFRPLISAMLLIAGAIYLVRLI